MKNCKMAHKWWPAEFCPWVGTRSVVHSAIVKDTVDAHKSGTAEGGEVARNQAPPHRLDWPINAMFILGIRKSKIKQNGYYLFFHFLLLNISHNAGKTLLLTHF